MDPRALIASVIGTTLVGLAPSAFATGDWHGHGQNWRERSHWHHHSKEDRLVDKYDRFAGSADNAEALVEGLRHDKTITLKKGSTSTSFNPPTSKMGWGNVDISLAIAKAALADHGIRNPTPEQIKAAMNGGTITTSAGKRVTMPGVLKLRASGMGWGQVAQKHGFKLGEVMRDHHHHKHAGHKHHGDHDGDRKHHHKHAHWKHEGKPDFHRAKFERPERHEKFERHHRHERPQRPERHERHGRK